MDASRQKTFLSSCPAFCCSLGNFKTVKTTNKVSFNDNVVSVLLWSAGPGGQICILENMHFRMKSGQKYVMERRMGWRERGVSCEKIVRIPVIFSVGHPAREVGILHHPQLIGAIHRVILPSATDTTTDHHSISTLLAFTE